MTSANADLLENELQEDLRAMPVSLALLFSSSYWQAAGALFVVVLPIWLTGPEPGLAAFEDNSQDQVASSAYPERQQIAAGVSPAFANQIIAASTSPGPGAAITPIPDTAALLGKQIDRQPEFQTETRVSEHLLTQAVEGEEIGQPSKNPHKRALQTAHGEPRIPVFNASVSEPLPDAETMGVGLNDGNYTIQLMGSRPVDSVIKFLASADLPLSKWLF